MMSMCESLMDEWGEGTVILSPKNVAETSIARHSRNLINAGASTLFDPQLYFPGHNHRRLQPYSYWPARYDATTFWTTARADELLHRLLDLNVELGTSAMILPAPYCETVDDAWLHAQESVIEKARRIGGDRPMYASVALSSDAVRNNAQVHELLDDAAHWPVDGVYMVFEHRGEDYLVDDARWMANALDVAAAFRVRDRHVVWGYCNQQQILAGCAAVDEIGVGTWMNGRMFKPADFQGAAESQPMNRSAWYYAPNVLSEYTPDRLDIAVDVGAIDSLRPPPGFESPQADMLFASAQPSIAGFREQDGFLHYLWCLRVHAEQATRATFQDTVAHHESMLNQAERLLAVLHSKGIRSSRDFRGVLDANRGALAALRANRGTLLARAWPRLTT